MAAFEANARCDLFGCLDRLPWRAADALGRSLLFLGEHARGDELPAKQRHAPLALPKKRIRAVPCDIPSFVQNRWSIGAFNALYYRAAKPGIDVLDYDRFFYPLDGILEWRRLYGRAGLVQYQCVLPRAAEVADGLTALLKRTAESGLGSFLGVLKLFGPKASGLLSFPMEGLHPGTRFPGQRQDLGTLSRARCDGRRAWRAALSRQGRGDRRGHDRARLSRNRSVPRGAPACRPGGQIRLAAIAERLGL